MAKLTWDQDGERLYETGTKEAVLYVHNGTSYGNGVAWNGLTAFTESPSGAEVTKLYANDGVYASLMSAEELGATIEAYTYPDEFAECDGSASPVDGMYLGQQARKKFGLVVKTTIGNDSEGNEHGYKLHILYGCLASPSEKSYATINDSPEAITFSWELTTTPVAVGEINGKKYKPVASIVVDSTKVDATGLAALEAKLYGSDNAEPELPTPTEIVGMLEKPN